MDSQWMILLAYGEIGLKGKNRGDFEKQLFKNVNAIFEKHGIKTFELKKIRDKCELYVSKTYSKEKIISVLKKVSGIKYFSFVTLLERDISVLEQEISSYLDSYSYSSISFKTKRSSKSFPLTSPEINAKLGEIARSKSIKVDYKGAPQTIYILVHSKGIYVYYEKIKGMEGLPVGSVGRVLCLLSGGMDSPVAAYQLLRRGCVVDVLHIHSLFDSKAVLQSKMNELFSFIASFQKKCTVYLLPSSVYEMVSGGCIPTNYDVIAFKHFVLKMADEIAKKNNYDAIVTGDNLAQVASQTMKNLEVTSYGISKQIFRPLLAYEKEEIVEIAKNIGTFEISSIPYKDCCSLIAKGPSTRANLDKFLKFWNAIDEKELLLRSQKALEVLEF
jgi:thiamine biosynthesis protein ThiI